MQRLRTVTSLDVSAVAGHHAMPAALLYYNGGLLTHSVIYPYKGLYDISHFVENAAPDEMWSKSIFRGSIILWNKSQKNEDRIKDSIAV